MNDAQKYSINDIQLLRIKYTHASNQRCNAMMQPVVNTTTTTTTNNQQITSLAVFRPPVPEWYGVEKYHIASFSLILTHILYVQCNIQCNDMKALEISSNNGRSEYAYK